VLGRADAPVTVELYEDFQCPACERWGATVFPRLAANEVTAGSAKVEFRDLAFLGPESIDAARAGYAAAQQGRFWDMWSTIYANQGPENGGALSADNLVAMAAALRLDTARFRVDMDSAAARSHVAASATGARSLGVDSTPTIVVAGRVMIGASYEAISSAIADAQPAAP
jgi:protein-disulfide isomerase